MKALYRRYRPKSLDEVIGQPQVTDVLKKSLANNRIGHSYIFVGPRGCGKTSVARIFAHEINQFPYELEDDYLDIIEIDAASNTGVDNIRDLREKAIIAPTKGKYKVYIIDEVHMLSKAAFNALLKTLEEPPEHVIFIMATTDAHKIPITITSRSQIYTFKLADPSTMFEHLKKIAKTEKIDIDDEALKIIVKRGGGSFRDSLSLLDQISTISDSKIDATLVNSTLGLPQEDIIASLLDAYQSGNLDTIRTQLQNLFDANIKAESIAESLISTILAAPSPVFLPLLDKLVDVSRASYPQIKLLLALSLNTTPSAVLPAPVIKPAPKPTVSLTKASAPNIKAEPQTAEASQPEKIETSAKLASEPIPTPSETPTEAEEIPAEAVPAPVPAKNTIQQISPDATDAELWQQITQHVAENAIPILRYIQDSDYQIEGTKLTIYAKKKFSKDRLNAKKSIIAEILPDGFMLEITDKTLNKDADLADIAALMGGGEEVQIDA